MAKLCKNPTAFFDNKKCDEYGPVESGILLVENMGFVHINDIKICTSKQADYDICLFDFTIYYVYAVRSQCHTGIVQAEVSFSFSAECFVAAKTEMALFLAFMLDCDFVN